MPSRPIGRRMPAFRRGAANRQLQDGQADATRRALAFDRMAAAARREAGLYLSVTSGFRSDEEQAQLFAAKPRPHLPCAL
jgi:LAS superfamily LD-carboxypeptidase LdcB